MKSSKLKKYEDKEAKKVNNKEYLIIEYIF